MAFALERRHVDSQPDTAHVDVDVDMVRNEAGRVRVGAMAVRLSVGRTWAGLAAATRALDRFDAYCVVTGSMRAHPDFGRRARCKRRRARMRDDRRVSARQRVRIRPRPPLRPLR
ncbi:MULTISPECIES: hypothetical protein [Burkholderia]|uniref:hypothetical protein n=1 Tax=Burkholderia TaxID=32008 RepID=UPI0009E11BC4|nr:MULTISPECIES: hypothetical protein [Burkholderia]ARF88373.1 disulfide bond formation regulator putative redox protein [Burkholderia cenocepacia]MDC6083933.1 hypothetical protein [Burkholderia cenocepacia]MDG0068542.1 hypothetical protein [Burkholderia sp. IO2]MEB2499393.1 hypothetical protein [Burkholderia cenocepacia]MEB2556175.1 hypothetical protein [Burkholderia cenocepacia]